MPYLINKLASEMDQDSGFRSFHGQAEEIDERIAPVPQQISARDLEVVFEHHFPIFARLQYTRQERRKFPRPLPALPQELRSRETFSAGEIAFLPREEPSL